MRYPALCSTIRASNIDTRRSDRRTVAICADLRETGQESAIVDVTDLSVSGFRAQTNLTLWPKRTVWLTLPGLTALRAVIAWRDQLEVGGAFAVPLHHAVFTHIVHRADA